LGALPITEALLIKVLPVDTDTNEPPKTESFTFEALLVDIYELDTNELAILIDTNKPVETNKCNEPAILFATVIEPLIGTSTGSIPKSLSTTTLISSQSIPLTNGCLAYTLSLPSAIPATGFGQFHAFQ
jgi:hypothetical protein